MMMILTILAGRRFIDDSEGVKVVESRRGEVGTTHYFFSARPRGLCQRGPTRIEHVYARNEYEAFESSQNEDAFQRRPPALNRQRCCAGGRRTPSGTE